MKTSVSEQGEEMSSNPRFKLKLKKFDISRINSDHVVNMIGKRRTGKSTIIFDILHYNATIPCGTVISGTEDSNKAFSGVVPSMFIHEEYNPMIISNVIKRQKLIGKRLQKDLEERGSSNIDARNFLIMDDCMYDESWTRDRNIRYLFMNGRHIKTLTVVTMQEPMGIPPALRSQVDFVFILRQNIISNRKKIYEQWAGMFPSFDAFCQVLDQCTENYECLVIDNTTQSNKLEDQVFWYKAQIRPKFRVCAPEYWAHSATHSRDAEDDGDGDFDPSTGGPRRRFHLDVVRR
jgi:hypothetical protein